MIRIISILVLVCCLVMTSCHTKKNVVKEANDITAVDVAKSEVLTEVISSTDTEEDESSEVTVRVVTTEYDTSRLDSSGNAPVIRKTETDIVKNKGKKTNTNTKVKNNISATKEESAKKTQHQQKQDEQVKSEKGLPLGIILILCAAAFIILACVLAYWFFSKYRAKVKKGI